MSNTPDIQALIFDLGRVLVGIDFQRSMFKLFDDFQADPTETIQKVMSDQLIVDYNTGRISPDQFHYDLCAKFNFDIDYDRFVTAWCDIFEPMPEMAELLDELQGRIKLGLFSNTDPLHWQYIQEKFVYLDCFTHPTLSFEIGRIKPDLESFRIAAHHVDTLPEHCLFIDDLPENVAAAQKANMHALQFHSSSQLRSHLTHLNIL